MEGRYFYSPKNAETDSTRILCDPYRFDIWHDVVKFSDSVVSLSEIDSHFPAVLENIRFAHLMERTLNHQKEILDNTKHAVHGNSQIVHNNNLLFKFDQLAIKDFLSLLPIVRPFSAIPNSQSLLKEISIKQLKKDFERDQVIINGCHMIGACSTIEGIISQMGEVLDRILINSHLSLLSSSTKNDVALLLLQLSSRTNSSGFAFEVLRQSIDFTDCLVRPVTDMVRSIGIHIALESPLSTSSIGSTGLIVEIHVSSFYRLAQHDCDSNDLEHPNQDSIEIIYQNHIYLPVDSRNSSRNNFSTLKPSDFIEGEIIFKRYGSFQ